MATFTSNLVAKKLRHRGLYSGKPYELEGRIFLAAGTVLTAGDILLGVPVGENQRIKEVTVMAIGDTGLAAGSVGQFQIKDKQGNPIVIQRNGPNGAANTKFTSPATSSALFAPAAQLDGYVRTPVLGVAMLKLAGPINVGVQITTGGTVGVDTELYIGCAFDGETSTKDTIGGGNADNGYLLTEK